MIFTNYESGWNFETLVYKDFWTLKGFARNLFFNGFHPVIPWTAFMLFGFWFGKLDLYNHQLVRNTFWTSFFIFIAIQIVSYVTITVISNGNQEIMKELNQINNWN